MTGFMPITNRPVTEGVPNKYSLPPFVMPVAFYGEVEKDLEGWIKGDENALYYSGWDYDVSSPDDLLFKIKT